MKATSARWRSIVGYLVCSVAYVALWLSLRDASMLFEVGPIASAWYPPRGMSLALVLFGGLRYWPAVLIGCLIAAVPYNLPHSPIDWVLSSASITLAVLLVAWATRRLSPSLSFRNIRTVLALTIATAVVEGGLAAYQLSLFVREATIESDAAIRTGVAYFVGDMIGIMIVVPFVAIIRETGGRLAAALRSLRWWMIVEMGLYASGFAALLSFVFLKKDATFGVADQAVWYLLLVPMGAFALRYGILGAAIGNLFVSVSIVSIIRLNNIHPPLLELQILLLALSLTSLFLGALMSERGDAATALTHLLLEAATRAQREAQRARASKARFISSTSHDLRQPLQSLIIGLDTLRFMAVPKAADGVITQLHGTAQSLEQLFDSLMDAARVEGEFAEIDVRPFPLEALLSKVKGEFEALAKARNIALKVAPTSLWGLSDPLLQERVLRNLVSNAVRHAPVGSKILVGCRLARHFVHLEVHNSGPGIPSNQLDMIFGEFVRFPSGGQNQGAGLGLAIVKEISERLGLDVKVFSRPNRGVFFRLTLPLSSQSLPSAAMDGEASDMTVFRDKIVAILEYDPVLRSLLAEMLSQWDAAVIAAESYDELVQAANALGADPDLLIADYGLSDGARRVDAALALRRRMNDRLPTIILSVTQPQAVGDARTRWLRKPTSAADLAVAARAVMTAE